MSMHIASGKHYFEDMELPVSIRRVDTDVGKSPSHPHDLTGIMHSHDFNELVIVTGGGGVHSLEGDEYIVSAGDVFLLQRDQRHLFPEREGLSLINIMYSPDALHMPEERLRRITGYCGLFLLEPIHRRQHGFASRLQLDRIALARAVNMVGSIESELGSRKPGYDILTVNLLLDLIVFLSRSYTESGDKEARALLRVADVISALERRFRDKWRLSDMLDIAHMSKNNFIRIFRRATGHSPVDYLLHIRMQRAMFLLRQGSLNVTEVALEVGFSDGNYFTRQFRQITGMTPTVCRNGL